MDVILRKVREFRPVIKQVYEGTNHEITEAKLLGELLQLLAALPAGCHLFCDKEIEPIATFCLTIFSFNEKDTTEWLKQKFTPCLATCQNCILHFTRGRCKITYHFATQRHVPHEHVSKFTDVVCHWRIGVLLPILLNPSVNEEEVLLTESLTNAIYECICSPHMLRLNKNMHAAFDAIFKYFYDSSHPILSISNRSKTFLAGLIYCWCEGTQEQVNWAHAILRKLLKDKFVIGQTSFTIDILQEINIHYLFLQNPSNWTETVISHFWSRLTPIFALFDEHVLEGNFETPKNIDSLRKSFHFSIQSLFILWCNHLGKTYDNKPLEYLLRALEMFLNKFGHSFWQKIEPYTFHSLIEMIFDKSGFTGRLLKLQCNSIPGTEEDSLLSMKGSVKDLLSWTLPFYRALSSSKRIQMVKKVSMFFLRVIANESKLESIPKACLMNSSTALVSAVLTIKSDEREMLYQKQEFETFLYTKTDSRALMNNPLIQSIVIQSITDVNSFYPNLGQSATSVSNATMITVTRCLDFDVLLLCHRTYALYSEKKFNDLPWNYTLLDNLSKKLDLRSFHDGPLLAKHLLISFKNVSGIISLPKDDTDAVVKHNDLVGRFFDYSSKILEKFGDILPKELHEILSDRDASKGFWSSLFCSNSQLSQAATNILYDAFDVQGRFEGIRHVMQTNLTFNTEAVSFVLDGFIKSEFFEPCLNALKILMDIVSTFVDPINGIFSNYNELREECTGDEVLRFWKTCWNFLDMIYRCTLKWASRYEYSKLENFTKDTLELSRSLISSFREFSAITEADSSELLEGILRSFKNMLYWLRLSDEALLESCVIAITSAADLAQSQDRSFDDPLIESMVKYACKAKRHSNKLSPQQSDDIIERAIGFNKPLAEKIMAEVSVNKQPKESVKHIISIPDEDTHNDNDKHGNVQTRESRADLLHRKAISSSLLGRPKGTQAKITSFGSIQHVSTPTFSRSIQKPNKQISQMGLARKQLLNNRIIHPPSSSGFRTKHKDSKLSESSSSDESDDDIESARALFASAKGKDKTIQTLDISGRVIVQRSRENQAKIDEEYMRKRLTVDLNPIYEIILQWDYTRQHEYPDDRDISNYTDVKDKFVSADDYKKVMQPLLLLEAWQGMCAARNREDHKPFSIIVGNRAAVADFYDIYASMPKKMLQDSGVSESDIIALAYFPDKYNSKHLHNEDFRRAEHTCLAKVKSVKSTKGDNVDVTLRIHRDHNFTKFLTLRAEIDAVKVMQMTTIEREYSTLEALQYYDLVNQIISAEPSPPASVSTGEIETVKKMYKLNASQAEAIVHTVRNDGFSLIQGPPGTGKTKTILGIIGYFLSTRKYLQSHVIKAPVDKPGTELEQMLKKQKVLICAPSNAAVDEICIRLKDGVYNSHGEIFKPTIVRVGRSDVVNISLRDITLEELVERRLSQKHYEFINNPELENNFKAAVSKRRELRGKLDSSSELSIEQITELQLKIRELNKELNELGRQRDEMRERNFSNYRNRDLDRRNAQLQILAGSDIICSTLSGAAHDVLSSLRVKFDTVVIDEACQCTELSAIIPLRYGGKRCIMVGDPNQLPPTVLSGAASSFKYNQSLFVRMEKNYSPYLLNVQYRMHPEISRFPSKEFYDGKLLDGPELDNLNRREWHEIPELGPYRFFDIDSGRQEQNTKTMSYTNAEEVKIAIELIDYLLKKYEGQVDFTGRIGIISPYKEQVIRMRRQFTNFFGQTIRNFIDFNTIDGFQGQEKEIIIISCVRADDSKSGVGFLKDFRRMNVALTRAKTSIWILGHRRSLIKSKLWNHLIDDSLERKVLTVVEPGFLSKDNNMNKKSQASSRKSKKLQSLDHETDDYDPASIKSLDDKLAGETKRRSGSKEKTNISTHKNKEVKGTKKRSSIFSSHQNHQQAKSSIPYIKPVDRVVESKVKDKRHVKFKDEVNYIGNESSEQTEMKRASLKVILEKRKADKSQNANSASVDYTPSEAKDVELKANHDESCEDIDDYVPVLKTDSNQSDVSISKSDYRQSKATKATKAPEDEDMAVDNYDPSANSYGLVEKDVYLKDKENRDAFAVYGAEPSGLNKATQSKKQFSRRSANPPNMFIPRKKKKTSS